MYLNELQKIINLNNLYINQIISLNLENNQNFHQSQMNLINLNNQSYLQRKRNPDESNNSNIFCSNFNIGNSPQTRYEINRGQNFLINNNNINENNLNFLSNNIINNNENITNNNNMNNISIFQNKTNFVNNNNNINTNDVILDTYNINNNSILNEFNGVNENIFNINSNNNNFLHINDNSMSNSSSFNNNITNSLYNKNINNSIEKEKNEVEVSPLNNNENNNEIKVLKNHKAVYVNRYLLKSPSSSKNLKKLNKIAFIGKTKRSSRYRGVSRNGNQWQVLIMLKRGKSYVGSYTSEEFAARIYDILAIKYRGIKARTNFKYSSEQIKTISETDIDIKSKDINDFISKLSHNIYNMNSIK